MSDKANLLDTLRVANLGRFIAIYVDISAVLI